MVQLTNLKVLFWNARGLTNKLTEFKLSLYKNNIDIACVCETFLKSTRPIQVKGYKTSQINRHTGRFGGLIMLTKESLPAVPLTIPQTNLIECMGLSINRINLVLLYLPGQASDREIGISFIDDIEKITGKFKKSIHNGGLQCQT